MDHVTTHKDSKTVVESHLPLVHAIARSYLAANRTYVQLDDLIEAGRSGLLQAFCRFNEERGVLFGTYATWWVKKEMLSWIRQERHPVQIPDHVYKAVLKTSKVAKRLGETFGYAPSLEQIAVKRGLTVSEVEDQLQLASTKKIMLTDSHGDEASWKIPDTRNLKPLSSDIRKALATIGPLESWFIVLRFGLDGKGERTLQEIASQLEIKLEKVRTIETKALRDLKHHSRCYLLYKSRRAPQPPPDPPKTRDNSIVYIAKAFAQQSHFLAAVAQAASALPVVSVTPTLGTDWNGESAVFFQIVIADGTPRGQLLNLTKSISQVIVQQVRPLEEWGVLPYFDFRTQSEQARIKEPTWA